jgi:hypothetical protein
VNKKNSRKSERDRRNIYNDCMEAEIRSKKCTAREMLEEKERHEEINE